MERGEIVREQWSLRGAMAQMQGDIPYRTNRNVVPPAGIEPALPQGNGILNPARLPVPPEGHVVEPVAGKTAIGGVGASQAGLRLEVGKTNGQGMGSAAGKERVARSVRRVHAGGLLPEGHLREGHMREGTHAGEHADRGQGMGCPVTRDVLALANYLH